MNLGCLNPPSLHARVGSDSECHVLGSDAVVEDVDHCLATDMTLGSNVLGHTSSPDVVGHSDLLADSTFGMGNSLVHFTQTESLGEVKGSECHLPGSK